MHRNFICYLHLVTESYAKSISETVKSAVVVASRARCDVPSSKPVSLW